MNWYSYCGGNPVMLIDPSGFASDPQLDENNTIVNYRLPLRDIVTELGGQIKLNENSVTVSALGKTVDIPYNDSDHNISGVLHFTVDEVLNLLKIEYDMEQVSFQVSKSENNRNTISFVAKKVISNEVVGFAKDIIETAAKSAGKIGSAIAGVTDVGFNVRDAVSEAGGGAAKVLPPGNYGKITYKVKTPKTGKKSGIISLTFSSTSDYVMLEKIHWSAEFNSNKIGGGYQSPGYVNIYSHR